MAHTERDQLEHALSEATRMQTVRTVLFIQAMAARVGINPIDLQCLNALSVLGPLTPSRLAETMSLTKGGAITAMIDRLEKAGYLHRRRDTADRRQVLVHITDGEPLRRLMAHFEPVARAYTDMCSGYTSEQLRVITEFITRGNDLFHRMRPADTATPPRRSRDLAAGS